MNKFDANVKTIANLVSLLLLLTVLWPMIRNDLPRIMVRVGRRLEVRGKQLQDKGFDLLAEQRK